MSLSVVICHSGTALGGQLRHKSDTASTLISSYNRHIRKPRRVTRRQHFVLYFPLRLDTLPRKIEYCPALLVKLVYQHTSAPRCSGAVRPRQTGSAAPSAGCYTAPTQCLPSGTDGHHTMRHPDVMSFLIVRKSETFV